MKKMTLLASCLFVLAACDNGNSRKEAQVAQERDSLMRIIAEKDNELNDLMGTFNDVQEGFRRISEAEGRVAVANANPENASSKEVIRENMQFIQEMMAQNRSMIEKLQEQLKASGFKADKLAKAIEGLTAQLAEQQQRVQELEAQLAEKDIVIAQQTETISSLNSDVTSLTEENQSKSQKVSEQDKQLHAAWFVFGTKAELKEQKILQSGDVLKTTDFNMGYFTQIDIRQDKEIKLYSKSAKLLTSHPAGTYTLTKDVKDQYVLKIVNPEQFWSVSRYLVVQVK
ncbi:MAG: hypothetical protein K2N13_00155 [Paraprevotella sp.]|nr:hypothetical protein [Paraprevotella sp.]